MLIRLPRPKTTAEFVNHCALGRLAGKGLSQIQEESGLLRATFFVWYRLRLPDIEEAMKEKWM